MTMPLDLRREALDDAVEHRLAADRDERLVAAAHAPAEPAGEDDAGDAAAGPRRLTPE